MANGPVWTADDLRFLVRHWGKQTEAQIGETLHRSATAIDVKAKRMRLGPCQPPGCFTAGALAAFLGIDIHAVMRWHNLGWLHGEKRISKGKSVLLAIMVHDVEEFLQQHPAAWDSRRAPGIWGAICAKRFERDAAAWKEPVKRSLAPERREAFSRFVLEVARDRAEAIHKAREEPDWLIAKHVTDMTQARRRFAKWTPLEDARLRYLLTQTKLTIQKIGAKIDRSYSAVEHRMVHAKTLTQRHP